MSLPAFADTTLWVHTVSTLVMTGVIWIVQLVHYPLFADFGRESFPRYERNHRRRITLLVAPLMIVEATTAAFLALQATSALTVTGGALVAAIWTSTALVQIPLHDRLSEAFDEAALRRLVAGNWLRTVAWTVRAAIALALLRQGAA